MSFLLFVKVIIKDLAGGSSLYPANSALGREHMWACTGIKGACGCKGASYRNEEEIAKLKQRLEAYFQIRLKWESL